MMSRRGIAIATFAVAALFDVPVRAGFDQGLSAYNAQDYSTAFGEWKPLADKGDREAQFRLGEMYLNAQGVLYDVANAVSWYEKAAAQEQPAAQVTLAMLYDAGKLVPADSVKALKWYVAAADNGEVRAQINLAVMYSDGKGVVRNGAQASRLMKLAAEGGNAIAQYNLGMWYGEGKNIERDLERSRYWYLQSANQGNDKAQYNLAFTLQKGIGGPADSSAAMSWMRKAADQNYAEAQCALGSMFALGQGAPRDYTQALYWYQKAADSGFAKAQANLGLMYREGNGVPQDQAMAARYYQLAANQGMAEIQSSLAGMYFDGLGVKQDYAKALKWYRKAADQGDLGAYVGLGLMYETGKGLPRDETQAETWYRKAADKGYRNGRDRLDVLKARQQSVAAGEDRPVDERVRRFSLVREGNLAEIEHLFSTGKEDPNLTLDDGATLLQAAIESHRFEVAKYLVEHGADVNGANSLGAAPLHFAAYYGMPELIPMLAQHGANLNLRLKDAQQSPLFFAVDRGDLKAAQALLQYGADPNLPNVQKVLPLAFAITGGHKEIARLLLEHGTRVDQTDVWDDGVLNAAAAQPGWSDIVKIIIARGAKCGVVNNQIRDLDRAADIEIVHLLQQCIEKTTGQAPSLDATLVDAARRGRVEFVKELIDAGAAVNGSPSGHGEVPLIAAMQAPNAFELTKVLIERGADPNRMNGDGQAALHRLGWQFKSGMSPLVDYLVKHGADVNLHANLARPTYGATMDPVGDTPLHFAVIDGHREYVEALLANGAQLEAPGKGEKTPLAAAIENGRTDIADLLLKHGADIDAKGHDMFSPLGLAVSKGQGRLVRYVLQHGASVAYRVADDESSGKAYPLRDAAAAGHLGIVKLLLTSGADPGAGAHDRVDSPLHTAVFYGQLDIVRAFFDKKPSLVKEFDMLELVNQTSDEDMRAYLLAKVGKKAKPVAKTFVTQGNLGDANQERIDPMSAALKEYGLWHFKRVLEAARREQSLRYWNTDGGRAYLLLVASMEGRADVVRYLLEQGVPPDGTLEQAKLPDELREGSFMGQTSLMDVSYGKLVTPLVIAAKGGNEDIASALLSRGANPNRRFESGTVNSALGASAGRPVNASMSEILLTHGALPATVGSFQFDQLVEGQQQEEIRLLFDFGLDRNDVGHHDGAELQAGELNRVNADAVDMIGRSRPERRKEDCHKMPLKELSQTCLPGELRDADAALQDVYTLVLQKDGGKNRVALMRAHATWALELDKACHVPARGDAPDGWLAAVLDERESAICVIDLMRQQQKKYASVL